MVYQVSLRVAGTTFDGCMAAADNACDEFFGTTPYTKLVNFIQAETDSAEPYDIDGKPVRYLADVQATTTE